MRIKIISVYLLIFSIIFTACKDNNSQCDQPIEKLISVNSLDLTDEMVSIQTKEEALSFIHQNPFTSSYFFNTTQQLSDTAIAELMVDIFSHPSYRDTLYQQVENEFGDFSDLDKQFSSAFSRYKSYYPSINIPSIKYVLSGLQTDMFVSDTMISIAADYYLGPDARFVPLGLPQYILKRYQKEYIVPMTMLLVTQVQNNTDKSNATLLADMIYYGKSYYLANELMPCTADSLFLGYSAKEMSDINKNEHIIWANFLENDLLYESSHYIKNKFIGERPQTFEISENCPGRIGLWVGWQIVKSYMENNPEVSLTELMKESDANLIFSKAKYKPRG